MALRLAAVLIMLLSLAMLEGFDDDARKSFGGHKTFRKTTWIETVRPTEASRGAFSPLDMPMLGGGAGAKFMRVD